MTYKHVFWCVTPAYITIYSTYTHPNTKAHGSTIPNMNIYIRDRLLWVEEKREWLTSMHRNRCKTV